MTENQKTEKAEKQELSVNLRHIARSLSISVPQVQAVIRLLDDGNTVPFITRYRKDETGNLNEAQIRQILSDLTQQRQLIERKQTILHSLESQSRLTPELASKFRSAGTVKQLEDLYFPFKAKKQTQAAQARRRGLEPLAQEILSGDAACADLNARAAEFVSAEKGLPDVESVLAGVGHILAEIYSEDLALRRKLRDIVQRTAKICTKGILADASTDAKPAETKPTATKSADAKATTSTPEANSAETQETPSVTDAEIPAAASEETPESSTDETGDQATADVAVPAEETNSKPNGAKQTTKQTQRAQQRALKKKRDEERRRKEFRDYFAFEEAVSKIQPYRVLAINRGENCNVLRAKVVLDENALRECAEAQLLNEASIHADFQRAAIRDALERLIQPTLERELRRDLTEKAETHAVTVFSKSLRNLLLQAPIHGQRVLAMDPDFRNGCKWVVLDQFGNFIEDGVVYLISSKPERREKAAKTICELIQKYSLSLIAISNSAACREAENFVIGLMQNELVDADVSSVLVNDAGASIYSISNAGREEFPNRDASLRRVISIGRRVQDSLSELVKIDPFNIGTGLYQHDVKAKSMRESLESVVESCVNFVGVDVNTASPAMLRFVSGLNPLTARKIYEYRRANGPFRNREQLKNVQGISEAAFVQAAGFLKITKGENPLDTTWIHPESYELASKVLDKLGIAVEDWRKAPKDELEAKIATLDVTALAKELNAGELTLKDILDQLVRPGRDPREDLPAPFLKKGVLEFDDLVVGMELTGTVQNVADFGVFVDIGMRECGLLHVSQLGRFVRNPHESLVVGDVVNVWVLSIDQERQRVSLTMVDPNQPKTDEAHSRNSKKRSHRSGRRNRGTGALPPIPQPVGTPSPEVAAIIAPETVELHLISEAPEGFVSTLDRPRRERRRGGRRFGETSGDGESRSNAEEQPRSERSAGSERPRRDRRFHAEQSSGSENAGSREFGDREGRTARADRTDRSNSQDRRDARPKRSEMPKYQYRKDVPKQPTVLTEDVKKGKAPMHGFAELAAFLQQKEEPKE